MKVLEIATNYHYMILNISNNVGKYNPTNRYVLIQLKIVMTEFSPKVIALGVLASQSLNRVWSEPVQICALLSYT